MDVLQQAGEAICQGDAEWCQQVVPVGLHVLTGPALGVTLAAGVLVVRRHNVGDEVVVTTRRLEEETLFISEEKIKTQTYAGCTCVKGARAGINMKWRWREMGL